MKIVVKLLFNYLAWAKAESAKYRQESSKKDNEVVKAITNQMRDVTRVQKLKEKY